VGIHWSTINQRVAGSSVNTTLASIMGMLVLDILVYSLLTWYLSRVVPNEFGTTQKPCFCCTRRFWAKAGSRATEHARLLGEFPAGEDVVAVEAVSAEVGARDGVEIRGLTKVRPAASQCALTSPSLPTLAPGAWVGQRGLSLAALALALALPLPPPHWCVCHPVSHHLLCTDCRCTPPRMARRPR
jgi:hypothetical protein